MTSARGILYKLISVAMFIIMSALIKATSADIPPGEAVFFRSFFALPVIFIWLLMRGNLRTGLRVISPIGHFWRGFAGTAAMGLFFTGLGLLPLPEVTAISYAAPLLTVVFAAMFLGETVRVFRLTAVALGLAGVMVILSPRLTVLSGPEAEIATALGAVLVFTSAVFSALAQVYLRKLAPVEEISAIVFYFTITSTSLSLLTIPFGWVLPSLQQSALLITAGLLGGLGQIFLTSSYRFAEASVVAPFDYASMLGALIIGYFIFDETPGATMMFGVVLVICAGILIIWRERQLGLQRGSARCGMTPQG